MTDASVACAPADRPMSALMLGAPSVVTYEVTGTVGCSRDW